MKSMTGCLIIVLLGMTALSFGQNDTLWSKMGWLKGEWVGEGSGQPGPGSGWFSLKPDLDGKILVRKNHAEYPATQDRPQIIHDDIMIIYPDNNGEPNKAIYFDNESHNINYSITYLDQAICFTSEKEPNSPIFRLTYIALSQDTINVKFEMSQDGETFMTYTEGRCFRKK